MARHEGWNTYADGYDSAAKDDAAEFKRLDAEVAALRGEVGRLRAVLDTTHKLVTEGALIGFIPTEGTWAERLYANQGQIHDALNKK